MVFFSILVMSCLIQLEYCTRKIALISFNHSITALASHNT